MLLIIYSHISARHDIDAQHLTALAGMRSRDSAKEQVYVCLPSLPIHAYRERPKIIYHDASRHRRSRVIFHVFDAL